VDLTSPKREESWDFYSRLFGWEIVDTGPEMMNYGIATLEGRWVAGIGEAPPGTDAPVVWTTYLATDDIHATATAITENGGSLIFPPMEVPDSGWMTLAVDPTGAAFGAWQAAPNNGAAIVNQPGTLVWNQLATTDPDAAAAFYSAVFGHTYTAQGEDGTRMIDGAGPGNTVGGLGPMGDHPAGTPSHWQTYFAGTDADAIAAAATAAGGSVVTVQETPWGRLAVLKDPHGARFAVMTTG
jgi:predicted enzyme related to lactoylglutathione lyase